MIVLDVGCGRNPNNEFDATYIRIDIRNYPATDVIADAQVLPFKDGVFDVVVASSVVEHLERPERFFREAYRVLNPHGKLKVRVPIGLTSIMDPTHKHIWAWESPIFFTKSTKYHGFDIPFKIEYRRYNDAWFVPPISKLSLFLRLCARKFGGVWLSGLPFACGQLEIMFKKEG